MSGTAVSEQRSVASGGRRASPSNWPLLLLIMTIPLQNIYLGKLPSLGAGLNYLNLVVLASILVWRMHPGLSPPTPTRLGRLIGWFMAVYVMSLLVGVVSLGELGEHHIQALKDILIGQVLYFIALNSVRDEVGVRRVLIAMLIPMPYMGYVFRDQFLSVYRWHYTDDFRSVSGTFMELGSNEIAAFFAGYTLVLITLLVAVRSNLIRAGLAAVILLNLYCLLYSYSRGSWMSFIIGAGAMLFLLNRKLLVGGVLFVALFSGAVISFLPVSVQERFETIFVEDESERDESAESRFVLWEIAMSEYAKSPVTGIGFHVFHHVNPYGGKDTHNYFVKVLTEQGPVGLGLLVGIVFSALGLGMQLFRKGTSRIHKALGAGVFGMVVAFSVGSMFGDRLSHYPLSAYFWVLLGVGQRLLINAQQHAGSSGKEDVNSPASALQ